MKELDKLNRPTRPHGASRPGKGLVTGGDGDCVTDGLFQQLASAFRCKG